MVCESNFSVEATECFSSIPTINEIAVNAVAQTTPRSHSATLDEIWRTHSRQILQITHQITNNREDAEDALQDSFLRAHVHLHSFDGRSSIKTWLTRIAINSALMILRKRARGRRVSSFNEGVEAHALDVVDGAATPEAQYSDLEQQTIVRRAISSLRPSIRRALELQMAEDRSAKEVAGMMGLSISATKSRIFHAKVALQKSLERKVNRPSAKTKRLQLSAA